MKKFKVWVSWSTGKDCAYTLHQLRLSKDYEVTGLLTTLKTTHREKPSKFVPMHRISEDLLKRQAAEVGLPLYCVEMGVNHDQQNYEQQMKAILRFASEQNVSHIAFGDLFLEDLRFSREEKMKGTEIDLVFPLWQKPTKDLAKSMINAGFKAIITSINLKELPLSFLGRIFNEEFLADLPVGVDPCGEKGEFHTFVFDGPIFKHSIAFESGETIVEGDHAFIQLNL